MFLFQLCEKRQTDIEYFNLCEKKHNQTNIEYCDFCWDYIEKCKCNNNHQTIDKNLLYCNK